MNPRPRRTRRKASTLIISLLVIVILSTIVVAFMQSMAIERLVARSYANRYRAQLAAQSGLDTISAQIRKYTTNDGFVVVRNGQFDFLGIVSSGSSHAALGNVKYLPLFSISTNVASNGMFEPAISATALPQYTNYLKSTELAIFKGSDPGGADVSASWVYVKDEAGRSVSRFAYYVQDLASLVDASVAGNNAAGVAHVRSGTNVDEVALYTIFDKTNTTGIESNSALVVTNRSWIVTPPTLRQIITQPGLVTNLLNLTANLKEDLEPDIVPFGMRYANEGQLKKNLNDYILTNGLSGMAGYISNNLPLFAATNRAGGAISGMSYLSNLCANIVDYADLDSDPTTDGMYVRGVDSFPFVTSHYLQFHWRRVAANGSLNPSATPLTPDSVAANFWYAKNGTWHGRVDVTTYIQIWNLTQRSITNGVLRVQDLADAADPIEQIYNRYSIYSIGNETQCATNAASAAAMPPKLIDFSTNTLLPNSFQVVGFAANSYECDTLVATNFPRPNLSSGSPMRMGERNGGSTSDHSDGNYRIYWNNKLIDRAGNVSGDRIERKSGVLDRETSGDGPDWRGVMIGIRYDRGFPDPPGESVYPLGDPRGNIFIMKELAANDYDGNSSWKGRHYATNLINPTGGSTPWIGAETLVSSWPDGGHDTQVGGSIFALNPATGTVATRDRNQRLPFDAGIPAAPIETNKAPMRIANSGTYTNVLDLADVYDPIQWRPNWTIPKTTDPLEPVDRTVMTNSWQSLHKILMSPDNRYVVPGSLRIGRAEIRQLNSVGLRSAQLLDIFTATGTARVSTKGRVNINTASRDTLRALAAGLSATNDPVVVLANGAASATVGFPESTNTANGVGDLFAETILSNRPFLSPAAMSWMTNANGGFFGNSDQYVAAAMRPAEWSDRAREEFFRKIFPLTAVRSRNFQIQVVGQALNPDSGKVLATVRAKFHLFMKPLRDSSGNITNQSPEIFYVHYE